MTAEKIAALEAAISAAQATLERAKAEAAAQSTGEPPEPTAPRLATWEDGVAAARAKYGNRVAGRANGGAEGGAAPLTGAAAGIAAARARIAARKGRR
ncbi:hypothetical protein [Geodermatophilus sp. URMC 62]|uniref:hypothetical protein n=1 Tax=Geodermatophilus sp. URMC 62 TaxID=3423414 RepID=UPI00406C98ED